MDFSSVTERGKEDHYYEREHYQTFPAPLVSEQGEWLPSDIEFRLFTGKATGELHHIAFDSKTHISRFYANTEANARMKCLLYLLENDIIDGNAFN